MAPPVTPKLVFGLDSSLNRPGFALIEYDPGARAVRLIRTSVVDNKSKRCTKPYGQRLAENATEMKTYLDKEPDTILVR